MSDIEPGQFGEDLYRTLFESIDQGFCLVQVLFDEAGEAVDYRFLKVNSAFETQTGLRDVEGRRMRELEPRHEEHWFRTYGRIARTGEPERFTNQAEHLGGRWYQGYAFRVGDPEARTVAILFNDVTASKQAEEELARERAMLHTVLEALPVGLVIADSEGRILRDNAVAREMWGMPLSAESWEDYGDFVAWWPDTGERIRAHEWAMARTLHHGEATHNELIHYQKFNSEERGYYLNNVAPIRDAEGKVIGGVVAMLDVTERREAEERLRRMIDVEDLYILIFDESGIVVESNRAFRKMFGYNGEEVESGQLSWRTLTPPEYVEATERQLEELQETGRLGPYEKEYLRKDGSRVFMAVVGAALGDGMFVKYCIDISDRKRAEEALRESEERFRTAVENLFEPFAIYSAIRDGDGEIVDFRVEYANTAACRDLGLAPEEYIGRTILDVAPEGWADTDVFEWHIRATEGETIVRDRQLFQVSPDPEAEPRYYDLRMAPSVEDGSIASWRDVTERAMYEQTLERRVEERTREVRRLAVMLTLAEQEERRRVAQLLHDDLQQVLYAVQLKLDVARKQAHEGERDTLHEAMDQSLGLIEGALSRTRQLTFDLSPPELEGEGLVDAVRWLETRMRDLHGLEVQVWAEPDLDVDARDMRVLLFQVIRELLFNVVKHAGTSRATVEIAEEERRLKITVTDEGRGFDPDALRPPGEDATRGFGIFSVRERLRLRGGDLEIDSRPGRGTRAVIYAPLSSSS